MTPQVGRLMTAAEVADLLGFKAGTIVDWAERAEMPAFKVGGRLRFRESEVVAWLDQRRVNGPGARGEASPTPSVHPARRLFSQASPTPLGGEHHA